MNCELVPLTRDEANSFIAQHHRHCGRVQAHRGAIGCEIAGRVVGVAILANPPSRVLAKQDRFLCEIVRLCVAADAPPNTCSWLIGRARRAAAALGFRRITTTTLAAEGGASLRASGFVEVARMRARKGWTCPSRPRKKLKTDRRAKVRWEATTQLQSAVPSIAPDDREAFVPLPNNRAIPIQMPVNLAVDWPPLGAKPKWLNEA